MRPVDTAAALVLLAFGLVAASAWLWGPWARREWRRWRVRRQPFPPAWRELLRRRWPLYARLPADLQLQLKQHVKVFLAEKPFIGCGGLEVTDEMRVLVAAQASLLQLNRRAGLWPDLRQVLLYPGAFVVDRVVPAGAGLQHPERQVLAGESWHQGQVILSWDDVLAGAADAEDGRNVVVHEFAHQLDSETGPPNGAPVLGRRERYARWAAVQQSAFEALQARLARGEPGVLDPYAATNPAEFFACASEAFFERPAALAAEQPALYAELAACYATNPLHWR